jgi:hypothetical protein
MTEEWRTIKGFPAYEVSNLGRVRIVRILKTHLSTQGYEQVGIYDTEGKQRHRRIHRLVCTAFNGPEQPDMHVAHLDGAKLNNRSDNLVWATPVENEAHKRIHGTRYSSIAATAKLTEAAVKEVFRQAISGGITIAALAESYGVTPRAIRDIRDGRTWSWLTAETTQ